MALTSLPGHELVEQGLRDACAGKETVEALLVAIAAPRLRRLGLPVPDESRLPSEPELRLYRLLRATRPSDAYSAYNGFLRRLVRFESALEHARRRDELRLSSRASRGT